ncbi:MAG: nucleotidyltransferase family protein [Methanoregula sp.]
MAEGRSKPGFRKRNVPGVPAGKVNALIFIPANFTHRIMDALALLRKHEPVIKKRFGVSKIGIFGSFVRGEERPDSDVDVLVTFRTGEKTFDNYMGCKFYLEDLFGRKVDLVMKGSIKKRLKPYILGEVVYA